MRIGQILIEAELISPKQLSSGLEYGKAKGIFLGKAMKLLKFMKEDDIELALQAQKFIRLGLSPVVAIEALKLAVKDKIPLERALQDRANDTQEILARSKDEEKLPAVDPEASADQLIETGDKMLLDDHCPEAEAHYLAALTSMKKSSALGDVDVTPLLNRLGNTYMAMERYDYAKKCYDKIFELRIQSSSEDYLLIAQALESIADLHKVQGEEQQAMETFLKALDNLERLLPSGLSYYASILRKVVASQSAAAQPSRQQPVGELLISAGLLSQKELETALRMSKQTQQPLGIVLRENCMVGDRELQSALKAQFCIRQGVLTEHLAIELLSRAARRGITLERLLHEAGVTMQEQEKYDIYREIASELDKLVAAESSMVSSQGELAPIAHRLGTLYEQAGDHAQAEIYYSRALKIWGAEVKGDLNAARTCTSLAKIHRAQNRIQEVVPLLLKALEHRQQALGSTHEETIETLEELAEAELESRNAKGALTHARAAVSSRESLGQNGDRLFRSSVIVGDCLRQLKNFEEAQVAYKKAMSLAQECFGAGSPATAAIIEKLGDLYNEQELYKTAVMQYKFALVIFQGAGKGDTQAAQSLQKKLSEAEAKVSQSTEA